MRLVALGMKKFFSSSWNFFDIVILIVSYVSFLFVYVPSLKSTYYLYSVFRQIQIFRIFKIFRVIKKIKFLKKMFTSLRFLILFYFYGYLILYS